MKYTKNTTEILSHASHLCLLVRNATREEIERACERMQEFIAAWLKSGDGDVLPCSGKTRDEESALVDVDMMDAILEVLIESISDEPDFDVRVK